MINTCFFLVCPCVAMCNCFNPNAGDDDDVTLWSRRVILKEIEEGADLKNFGSQKDGESLDLLVITASAVYFPCIQYSLSTLSAAQVR